MKLYWPFIILILYVLNCNCVILYEKRCKYRARYTESRIVAETKNILTSTLHRETFHCPNPITFFQCHRVTKINKYKQIVVYKVVNEVKYKMKKCCCRGEQRDSTTDMCEPICTQRCRNNGVCIRPDTCSCTPYWEGETCHSDVNECHNSPCEHDCQNLVPGFECSCKLGYKVHDTDPTLCTKHTVSVDNFSVESYSLTQARINWELHSTFELSELLESIKITFSAENETSSISSINPNLRSLTVIGLSPNTLYTFKIEIILHNTIPMEDRVNLTGIQTIRFHTPSMLMTQCLIYHNERQRELSMSIITHQIDPNPCNNNGECTDNDFAPYYTCKCPFGLTGQNCNELYDPCSESDCQNGGTCIPTADRSNYTCTCPALYTGAKCDVRISPCITNPNLCLHGAVCTDRPLTETGYECVCATGYIGRHCEVSYTYCDDRICLNNGECVHNTSSGESQCMCSLPYYGERCEITMEPCVDTLLNPCRNNGLCYNYPTDLELNEPFCACPSHAIGMHCESTCIDEDGVLCDCDTQGQCV